MTRSKEAALHAGCDLDGLDALRTADVPVGGRISLIGTGSRSHAFQRVLADLSQRAVAVPQGERIATFATATPLANSQSRSSRAIAAANALR